MKVQKFSRGSMRAKREEQNKKKRKRKKEGLKLNFVVGSNGGAYIGTNESVHELSFVMCESCFAHHP
jgi:hypothetical protein